MRRQFNCLGEISYNPKSRTHICSLDGESVKVINNQPNEFGTWLHKCKVCGANAFSGVK